MLAINAFELYSDTLPFQVVQAAFWALLWASIVLLPMAGLVFLFYYMISLPLRRQERARFVLHLIDTGFTMNRTPEDFLTAVSNTRDRALGARLHLLAAHIQSGLSLGDAVAKVPRLLPPPAAAMLRAGEAIGDIRRVLPACRRMLSDGSHQMRSAQSYAFVVVFCIMPVIPILVYLLRVQVLPRFEGLSQALGEPGIVLDSKLLGVVSWLSVIPIGISFSMIFYTLGYFGGPQFVRWIQSGIAPVADWAACRISWKRMRMQRDFFAMLGLLLDANVPERRAVQLAAESTANRVLIRQAQGITDNLTAGTNLIDALRRLDGRGELKWRFENAAKNQGGFASALAGWLEALDTRAFQHEQTAAQVLTTSLVVFNGVVVGTFMVVLFGFLVDIVKAGCAW